MNGWRKHLGFRNCILGAIFLALAVWLATGFAFVPPKSVRVFYGFTGFLNGELQSNKVAHFNYGDGYKLIWKGPIIPELGLADQKISLLGINFSTRLPTVSQNKIGQERETIDLNLLNINSKSPLWTKDQETGNPNDRNIIASVVVSGTLVVKDWGKFLEKYDPTELNAQLQKEYPASPLLGTMDAFVKDSFQTSIVATLQQVVGALSHDTYYRYLIAQAVISNSSKAMTAADVQENLRNDYPWVLAVGAENYIVASRNPQAVVQYVQSSPVFYYLFAVVDYEQFQDQLPDTVDALNEKMAAIKLTTRPELFAKAVAMLEKFQVYLKARNRDLSFYSENTLTLEASQFVQKENYEAGELLVFSDLLSLKWQESLLSKMAAEKKKGYDEAVKFFRSLPELNEPMNLYAWQLAIQEALEAPGETPDIVAPKFLRALVRYPGAWVKVNAEVPKSKEGIWEIQDLSVTFEDRPLLREDGQIDRDFYWLYRQRELQAQGK